MSYFFSNKSLKEREKLFKDLTNIKVGDLVSYTLDESNNKEVYGVVFSYKKQSNPYSKWYDISIISDYRLVTLIINTMNVCKLKIHKV
mgnify:CR=1 FL=1|tara:strand:- start:485 stop:748 length:264 start_codon:yes stop_codon:yes gene_type:complete